MPQFTIHPIGLSAEGYFDMTPEFEQLKNDPDLQSEPGPGGTLIFLDGSSYCVIGPEFVNMEESDCYAFGDTREEAIVNYRAGRRDL